MTDYSQIEMLETRLNERMTAIDKSQREEIGKLCKTLNDNKLDVEHAKSKWGETEGLADILRTQVIQIFDILVRQKNQLDEIEKTVNDHIQHYQKVNRECLISDLENK